MNIKTPVFRGVYLFVKDLGRSVRFYERLGLASEVVSAEFARFTWTNGSALELGSAALTSSYDPNWQMPGDPSKNSLNFEFESADEVDEMYERIVSAGYASQLAPCLPPWQARFAIVLDPDGNIIGLHGPRDMAADRVREGASSNS